MLLKNYHLVHYKMAGNLFQLVCLLICVTLEQYNEEMQWALVNWLFLEVGV